MDELIRKQDALDAFNGNVTISAPRNAGRVYTYLKMVTDRIKALPPVYVPDTNDGNMISRQAAMESLMAQNVIMDGSEYHNGFNAGVNRAQEVIRNLPPAQTEIIHCKDCKFYGRADKRRFYRGSDCLNKHIDTIVPDRDFCSRAEKRGEADG